MIVEFIMLEKAGKLMLILGKRISKYRLTETVILFILWLIMIDLYKEYFQRPNKL